MKQKQMNIKYVSLTLVIFDKAFFSSSSSFLFIFSLFFSLFFKLLVFFFFLCHKKLDWVYQTSKARIYSQFDSLHETTCDCKWEKWAWPNLAQLSLGTKIPWPKMAFTSFWSFMILIACLVSQMTYKSVDMKP